MNDQDIRQCPNCGRDHDTTDWAVMEAHGCDCGQYVYIGGPSMDEMIASGPEDISD